jgi:dienelactone hydrolase
MPQVECNRAQGRLSCIDQGFVGAHHGFDSNNPVSYNPARVNGNSPTGCGATTGGDPKAWDDSVREVIAFFGHHLKKPIK